MYQPHNIFAFEEKLILYIYVADGNFEILDFTDFADRAALHCVPREVKVVYPEGLIDEDTIKDVIKQIKSRFRCSPAFFTFDSRGKFGANESTVGMLLEKARDEIIRRRDPVLLPPPGKSFSKPSGAHASFFIQASNLFVRHAEMSLFALLLIREWGDLFDENIRTVYVDTIDLYGLVSLACRMRFGSAKHTPVTVSYSSYSGYKDILRHATVSSSLMVISATTSHKLLRKIMRGTRWKSDERVVTILDLDESLCTTPHLVGNPKVITHLKPAFIQPHYSLLPTIRLSGEKFTVEVDEPKSVVLNTLSHAKCLKHLKLPSLGKLESTLGGYAKIENDRAPIHVDGEKLLGNAEFLKWLKAEIDKYAPISTSHIILIGGTINQVSPLLNEFKGKLPTFLSQEQLRDPALRISGSAIVICPTFSKGTKLLEVSRDLRKQKKLKHTVYFTGVGTPESLADFTKLKKNLEHGVYQLRSFCNMCTGTPKSLSLSWEMEQKLLRDEKGLGASAEMKKRAKILEDGTLNNTNLFYGIDKLEFHPKFKYWQGLLPKPSKHPSILLFSTFAFLLQNARVDKELSEKDKLASLANRRVLLDPENFFRYNDSLIQIAILRAAFPSDLDYSDHDAHSASLYYLVERAVQSSDGAVVYEFLLAIATNRLRITRGKTWEVRNLIWKSRLKECRWFKKVKFYKEVVE